MKFFYFFILIVFLLVSSLLGQNQDVALSFITVNGYGNNLYIDNLNVGSQFSSDVAVVSLNNVAPDTSYALGSSAIMVSPNVTIINIGSTDISTPFDVIMSASPGGYSSTKSVASINSGSGADIIFDPLSITPNTPIDITIYSMLPGDENTANDTLDQYSLVFPGVQRSNVLLQEWTSSTCPPCASNNPTIDAFVDANFDSIVPVKYHVWWPSAGDPMYDYNQQQNTYRVNYYGVGGVPNVIMDGVTDPGFPYTTPGVLQNTYDLHYSLGTPIEITVTDTPIPGDSIQADVSITIHAPLKAGDYVLQVEAVERHIHYATAPGSNGETDFYDVFRRAYPDEFGTPLPTSIGTHNFTFKYALDMAVWVDSMMYTIAYVQDNVSHEIWGSAKGNTIITTKNNKIVNIRIPTTFSKPMPLLDEFNFSGYSYTNEMLSGFNYELFEATFPPAGWTLVNPDGGITFDKYEGANGNSFGGNNSVFVDFVSYGTVGETDTLYTRVFTDVSLTDSIKFEYAYAEYPNYGPDRLIVKLSDDGGITFPYTIFDKSGPVLATAPATTNTFVPTSGQWVEFAVALNEIVVNSIPEQTNVIRNFTLDQNYPNPFNPSTYISYTIPTKSTVSLKIYNLLGQEVRTLVDNITQSTNSYQIYWNGKDHSGNDVSSGVYYYKLVSQSADKVFEQSKKMLLIK